MKKVSTLHILEPHSKAKVELYIQYLSTYLNIIERTTFINKIFIFDLFAGEGFYEDGNKGSSIQSIEAIIDHFSKNGNKCKDIEVLFNDPGYSIIESGKLKIERIRDFVSKSNIPENIQINYSSAEYSSIINHLIPIIEKLRNDQRAIIFLDPWGYKDIRLSTLKQLLKNGKTEILLFLPVYFMYRFANRAFTEGFDGGESLELFLRELFKSSVPNTKNVSNFISDLKIKFQEYMNLKYIDTFTIRRDQTSVFCLFFFTSNKIGYQKMINTKWRIDKEQGKGYDHDLTGHLFEESEVTGFDEKLKTFILTDRGKTNSEIKDFCFEEGFLPKHAGQTLQKMIQEQLIEIVSLDGQDIKGLYIDNDKRRILFKKVKN